MKKTIRYLSSMIFVLIFVMSITTVIFAAQDYTFDGKWVTENGIAGVRVETSNVPDNWTAKVVYYKDELSNPVQTTLIAINQDVFIPNKNGGNLCTFYIYNESNKQVNAHAFTSGIIVVPKSYTVIYTDGVAEKEIFTDQIYADIEEGAITPEFQGVPARKDYKFIGWNPEVEATVTKDVTYEAQWDRLYTVTYTDGVDGEEVFADQIHTDIENGTATPSFNGTPTREGYKFVGWNPEVAATVTEDVVYEAQWEKLYTVTYTDGVIEEAIFTDQIYTDIEEGTITPVFKGIPSREGYKFMGWKPEVAATVTEDAIYVAQWEKVVDPVDPTTKPTETIKPSQSESETAKPVTPKTGENSNLILPIILSGSAIMLALSVVVIKKKNKNQA